MRVPGGATARRAALLFSRSELVPNRLRPALLDRFGLRAPQGV